ncbi:MULTISPECIES: hypothetical protein [unclassified Brenneria]|uniref:hypothetical protein n=1 Tax=Brenneria sp. L3-3C-1 TaxID=2799634 RepID=UPI0018F0997F|nr:hypothetical protein [Brenneria sp. L3-3C-1]MBJ7223581.1 hypothetical protein [Brenneria sp. L3-3C-1]MEE3644823.1 hypothetical protein [Brenneria sp. L3_3C_1]
MATANPNGHGRSLLFPIGALIFSEGIDRLLREGRIEPLPYLQRHIRGDWGDVSDEGWQANNDALQFGARLESIYVIHRELSIRIVTEPDRSATHILLAAEQT